MIREKSREPLNMFQMSFSKILASSLMLSNGEIVRSPRSFPTREIEQDRRYYQLVKFMEYYNINFDERKYWTYGCNCHILGDRPMSDPGYGPPVGRLDSVCKQYKDCNKCARERFGESCIGELVQYRYGQNVSVLGSAIILSVKNTIKFAPDSSLFGLPVFSPLILLVKIFIFIADWTEPKLVCSYGFRSGPGINVPLITDLDLS